MEAHITREDEFKVINDVNEILVKVLVAQGEKGDKGDPGNISSVKVNGTEITPVAGAVDVPVPTDSHINDLIANAISGITGIDFEVVEELPATGENGTIYLILNGGSTPNIYDEYIYVNGAFEKIGTTEIDLSHYVQDTRKINNKPLSSDINLKTSDLTNDSDFVDKDYLENGKNLWNYNATNTIVGVSSTYNNSTLTLNGTSTGETSNISHTNMTYLRPGTYTFKIAKESGSATGSQAIIFKNITTNTNILNTTLNLSTGNTYTFTLQNSAWVSLAIYFFASNVFTNLKLDIQIEEGSSATPYEKYYGKYLNKGDGILIPYTLYDNTSGSTENITLSDNVKNYKYIEIYYKDETNAILCQKTYSSPTILFINRFSSDGANFQYSRTIELSQNTITTTRYGKLLITSGGSISVSSTNNISITRVIGYK